MIQGIHTPAASLESVSLFQLFKVAGWRKLGSAIVVLFLFITLITYTTVSEVLAQDQTYYDTINTLNYRPIISFLNNLAIFRNLPEPYYSPSINFNFWPLSSWLIPSLPQRFATTLLQNEKNLTSKENIFNFTIPKRISSTNFYTATQVSPSVSLWPLAKIEEALFPSFLNPFVPFFEGPKIQPIPVPVLGNQIRMYNARIGLRRFNSVASLVLANATKGMNCWDPISWLEAGLQVNIWDKNLPVRGQSFDEQGHLLDAIPSFTIQQTGQSGSMSLFLPDILLFEGLFQAEGPSDYLATVTVDTVSTTATIRRRYSTCDACHLTPPGHIAVTYTWGRCHNCHSLDKVIHVHAYNAGIATGDCYQCHPTGCLSGFHGQIGVWCTNCHGNLADAVNSGMKISGQLGLPHCADCHDPLHSENSPNLFINAAGHGGVWCINCHGATHAENIRPFGYNPLGYNSCEDCHKVQASTSWMGPNCGVCHGSSVSPHLVTR